MYCFDARMRSSQKNVLYCQFASNIWLYYSSQLFKASTRLMEAMLWPKLASNVIKLQCVLNFFIVIRRFEISFSLVASLLNRLRKGQLQRFDELADHVITALQVWKARLREPPVFCFPRLQGFRLWTLTLRGKG